MAHKIGDRIKETASTSGLADFTLSGAMTGFDPFSAMPGGWVAGDTTWYCAVNASEWEIGLGTRGGSTSALARTTVLQSSAADAKVNFSAAPVVFCTVPASVLNAQREVLAAARTYYVRTDGSDNNTGLTNTAGGAFLTLQKAADAIDRLDLNGFDVTVQVADGTYTGGCTLPPFVGRGNVTFLGNAATPANVLINTTGVSCFTTNRALTYNINGFKLQSTARGLLVSGGALVNFSNLNFGVCSSGHMAITSSRVVALTNYTISGGASGHAIITDAGSLDTNSKTITLTGTPAFASLAFVYMRGCAVYSPFGCTFVGAATGTRYNISNNATIFVNGAPTTFLPGDAAGLTSSGATYA